MTGVLKKEQVKQGPTRVLSQTAAPASPARPAAAPAGRSQGAPPARPGGGHQARVVEQSGLNVLIEVTCECGQKIYLSCECG